MTELLFLGGFSLALLACLLCGQSILWALGFGYLLFFGYGLLRRHSPRRLLGMSWQGVRSVGSILLTLLLIGMLTAVWRASGTIAWIIYHSARLVSPHSFLLVTFLLCCMISLLTGTAFGTAATAGVICMTIAMAMGLSPFWFGGAILSGAYFGDRASPMSTSALLVCTLTKTDIYRNIRNMLRASAVPFAFACALYLALGLRMSGGGSADVWSLFSEGFRLHWTVLLPAVVILGCAAFRVPVRAAMAGSIAVGCAICVLVQGTALGALPQLLLSGFHAAEPRLAAMMDGGGVRSMLQVAAIIFLSSCYAGLFDGTGFLAGVRGQVRALAARVTRFGCVALCALLTSMISCNQTLSILLTQQLCRELEPDGEHLALLLENTSVVLAPLIPWSIAGAVPMTTVGAPRAAIGGAVFLMAVPVWQFFAEQRREKHPAARKAL